MYDGIIKELTFSNSVCKLTIGSRNKEKMVYERDIQQQEEEKDWIEDSRTSCDLRCCRYQLVTHYFDESFLRTEEDYVNTYSKSHLSDSIVERQIFSEEFAMIFLIHA